MNSNQYNLLTTEGFFDAKINQKFENNKQCPKPTQQIYRPPSARIDGPSSPHQQNFVEYSSTFSKDIFHPSKSLVPQNSQEFLISNVFPIKGVLKRSKSFGNNNKTNTKNYDEKKTSYKLLDETTTNTFFLTLEGVTSENIQLIKQALKADFCFSLTMTHLLQIIRVLCNKVLERPNSVKIIAQVCMEIHYNQQLNNTNIECKYLFLESLVNCLQEWFDERDKLRFTAGGARRWTSYLFFLMEIYLILKEEKINFLKVSTREFDSYRIINKSDSEASNGEDGENSESEIDRAFDSESANESEKAESCGSVRSISSGKSGSSERSISKTSNLSIDSKIFNSLITKQHKQFSNLILDSFQVILANPNSTPAEFECMQIVFRNCGKYIEEDNSNRLKNLISVIRDILLNYSIANHFVNANNNISKILLEIIELSASDWKFSKSQQVYYFSYTKLD